MVFVGERKLTTNVTKTIRQHGFHITQICRRTKNSDSVLAHDVKAAYTNKLNEIQSNADLYIISLKDSAFVELIGEICKNKNEEALFVHTAGSIPMSIWEGYAKQYGVFYPLQTFSKQREIDFKEIPFFIEASTSQNAELLREIASNISDKVYEATSEQRKSLHLAAVFTCNFTNHLYALAAELLQKYNLPFEAMLPLIDETARKVHELTPKEAQTGPAIRYDEQVISKHLQMLADDERKQQVYELMSKSIHERAK